jgi:predicted lysophospholipase L1 biosynthesis ABC-type transport system permease subunit
MGYQKIISGILIVFVAIMSFKHGLKILKNNVPQGDLQMKSWGINKQMQTIISIATILMAIMILFPQSFLIGNILGAIIFIVLMCFQLNTGNVKAALIEIPFLLITFLIIYLGHPLKK